MKPDREELVAHEHPLPSDPPPPYSPPNQSGQVHQPITTAGASTQQPIAAPDAIGTASHQPIAGSEPVLTHVITRQLAPIQIRIRPGMPCIKCGEGTVRNELNMTYVALAVLLFILCLPLGICLIFSLCKEDLKCDHCNFVYK